MGQTKLTTVRFDRETIDRIDAFARQTRRATRSGIIKKLMKVVMSCASNPTILEMMNTYDPYSAGYTVIFTDKK